MLKNSFRLPETTLSYFRNWKNTMVGQSILQEANVSWRGGVVAKINQV